MYCLVWVDTHLASIKWKYSHTRDTTPVFHAVQPPEALMSELLSPELFLLRWGGGEGRHRVVFRPEPILFLRAESRAAGSGENAVLLH